MCHCGPYILILSRATSLLSCGTAQTCPPSRLTARGSSFLQPPSARVRLASDLPDLLPPEVGDVVELRVPVDVRAVLDILRVLKPSDWVKVRNVHSVFDSSARGLVHRQICVRCMLCPAMSMSSWRCFLTARSVFKVCVAHVTRQTHVLLGLSLGYVNPRIARFILRLCAHDEILRIAFVESQTYTISNTFQQHQSA
jgi:hypothetical protein